MEYKKEDFIHTNRLLEALSYDFSRGKGRKRNHTFTVEDEGRDGELVLRASLTTFRSVDIHADYSFHYRGGKGLEDLDLDFARYLTINIINILDSPY